MSTVAELIERLERAEVGSRALDLDVAVACSLIHPSVGPFVSARFSAGGDEVELTYADGRHGAYDPRFFGPLTTSLDAALTLVPEGFWWEVRQMCAPDSVMKNFGSRNGMFSARVGHSYGEHGFPGDHDKPALALCIAALKAQPRKARQSLTTKAE